MEFLDRSTRDDQIYRNARMGKHVIKARRWYKRHIGLGALLLNVCFTLDLDSGTLGEAIDTNCHPNR